MESKHKIGDSINGFVLASFAYWYYDKRGRPHKRLWFVCPYCGCGFVSYLGTIVAGKKFSCGCINRNPNFKHGLYHSPIFSRWQNIIARCYNKNSPAYKWYGGRGIKMCKEWKDSFKSFHDYVTKLHGYNESKLSKKENRDFITIDRINNDDNYEPGNVQWVGIRKQCNNRSSNRIVVWEGVECTLMELLENFGLQKRYDSYLWRLKNGWPIKKLIETPLQQGNNQFTLK